MPVRRSMPTLGILGGGQLGRMTALAAIRMGVNIRILSPHRSGPEAVFANVTIGDWTDPSVLRAFAKGCDVVTAESEWVPVEAFTDATDGAIPVYPRESTLKRIRHKGRQKTALLDAGLSVPEFVNAKTLNDAKNSAAHLGYPVMLKKFEGSYDGYGNHTCRTEQELAEAWNNLAAEDGVLVEAWVPFDEELAVLIARRPQGQSVAYPVVHTEQRDHRCHAVVAPADISEATMQEAQRLAQKAVEIVDGIGVTAVELFKLTDGTLLINELAPRPHNTGHYTIEACHASQFENHVRAVLDWPLGNPSLRVPAACMINLLGHKADASDMSTIVQGLSEPDASIHLYDKLESKPRRKMGHITVTASNPSEARVKAENAAAQITL
ncbi:MAG: 5-(carboxyamino)imidazole ribonucleotide synthase [Rubricoccaceae bacterium]|nr:5-(carboxyamino)imidazole ribonucleotide synthase [Rubricoccaceae bacterium]